MHRHARMRSLERMIDAATVFVAKPKRLGHPTPTLRRVVAFALMSFRRTPSTAVDVPNDMKRVPSVGSLSTNKARHALDVVVDDVSYTVTNAKASSEPLALLSNVTASFEHGKVHALMGASGAGKTTLLDVITDRVTSGEVTGGGVYYGGRRASKALFRQCAAYVEQRDTLLAMLTVKETLNYWAELRARNEEERVEILARVPAIIEDLNLGECSEVIVGDALKRGISGGQAKRTNLALALVTDPDVLFLDEPTSGLDSATSLDIVQILKNLAGSGVTVVATIHSPTSEAFRLFDSLLMLKKGRVAFAGALDSVTPYFRGLGYDYDASYSMADFFVGTVASDDVDFVGAFAKSAAGAANASRVKSAMSKQQLPAPPQPKITRGAMSKVATLIKYRTRYNYKTPDFVAARSAGNFLFGFVMMSLFWKIGEPTGAAQDQSTQLNVASLLSMLNILPSFQASGYMPSVVMERAMFYREVDDGVYPLSSYIAYKIIEEGVLAIPVSLIAQMMLYLGCGIQGSLLLLLDHKLRRHAVRHRFGVRVRRRGARHGQREHAVASLQRSTTPFQRYRHSRSEHAEGMGVVSPHALRPIRLDGANEKSFSQLRAESVRGRLRRRRRRVRFLRRLAFARHEYLSRVRNLAVLDRRGVRRS